jgi:fructose-bisphosphate aldolase class 1
VYAIPGQAGATVMQGLDSLSARCKEYKAAGIKFAKWRRCGSSRGAPGCAACENARTREHVASLPQLGKAGSPG